MQILCKINELIYCISQLLLLLALALLIVLTGKLLSVILCDVSKIILQYICFIICNFMFKCKWGCLQRKLSFLLTRTARVCLLAYLNNSMIPRVMSPPTRNVNSSCDNFTRNIKSAKLKRVQSVPQPIRRLACENTASPGQHFARSAQTSVFM